MAHPKPRRPKPGRGLPLPPRLTPEEQAEDEKIRRQMAIELIRLEACFEIKREERRIWIAEQEARQRALEAAEAPSPWHEEE